jgi:hypothetical protein
MVRGRPEGVGQGDTLVVPVVVVERRFGAVAVEAERVA